PSTDGTTSARATSGSRSRRWWAAARRRSGSSARAYSSSARCASGARSRATSRGRRRPPCRPSMPIFAGIALGCAVGAGSYQLFQLFAAWWSLGRGRPTAAVVPSSALPAVTVLKPLKGPGVELYENLASFCRQDYPRYQIVCGVEDAADPALAIVRRLQREFPATHIVVTIGQGPGTNRKVANLRHMMRQARHDVLVVSDADIRVRPDYLRTLVAPFVAPAVVLTTCLYRGRATLGAPSILESLFINTDFTPMVIAAQLLEPFEYAFGASIAVRRRVLDQIGGFPAL